jgi:sugar/nucleoside kinase (ribokinase family)
VLITLGARGSLLADAAGITAMPPYPVSAVDTSGAGDAFIGSLSVFLSEGVAERDAVGSRESVCGAVHDRRGHPEVLSNGAASSKRNGPAQRRGAPELQ